MQIDKYFYMDLAINEAWKYQLLTYPNPAVGATVVKNGEILSVEAHKKAGLPHAEVEALKAAYLKKNNDEHLKSLTNSFDIHNYLIKNHNNFFIDCEIYVTLEPCNHIGKTPACSNLIKELQLKKVFVGTLDPNVNAMGGIQTLKNSNIEVEVGILEKKAQHLLYPFIKWNKDNFVFFKMAQRLNGSVDGGYITSKESLEFVHKLRDKIDLLLIGGNSVRVDRPTLDARFCKGKAPNILIFSKKDEKEFDKTINLFKIEDRKVYITDNIDSFFKQNKFIMIEGIYNLLNHFINRVDIVLLFISPKIKDGLNSNILKELNFEILHISDFGCDKLLWMKKLC